MNFQCLNFSIAFINFYFEILYKTLIYYCTPITRIFQWTHVVLLPKRQVKMPKCLDISQVHVDHSFMRLLGSRGGGGVYTYYHIFLGYFPIVHDFVGKVEQKNALISSSNFFSKGLELVAECCLNWKKIHDALYSYVKYSNVEYQDEIFTSH